MKKTTILILLLCLLLSACGADIELYEDEVELVELIQDDGELMGYVKSTYGTNRGMEGVVLVELCDREQNVLQSISPSFPGGTLEVSADSGPVYIYEYTELTEDRGSYCILPTELSHLYSYTETGAGGRTKVELYGTDGKVVKTVNESDPEYTMEVGYYGGDNYFCVNEYVETATENLCTRSVYYRRDGAMMGDFRYTETSDGYIRSMEVRNEDGDVLYTLNASAENCFIHESYLPEMDLFLFSEEFILSDTDFDWVNVLWECREPETMECVWSVRHVFEDGQFSHTEMAARSGRVEVTEGPAMGKYEKLAFYNADDSLKAVYEAPEGGWLELESVAPWEFGFYDANGEYVRSEFFTP